MARTPSNISDTNPVPFDDLLGEAMEIARNSMPPNTIRAYRTDWKDFQKFCHTHKACSLPARPETVCAYLAARSRTLKVSTIRRRLTVIGKVHGIRHEANPLDDRRVRQTWRGLLRQLGTAENRKAPALLKDLRLICEMLAVETVSTSRDKALILVGFAGAMRRSELVALDWENVQLADEGLVVFLARGKTDQCGAGRKIGIPYGNDPLTCPVRALLEWQLKSGFSTEAIFRKVNRHDTTEGNRLCAHSVALIVKKVFRQIGRPSVSFSGHSLRAGLATQAAMSGASERSIQKQTGHKSLKVLRSYIRDGNLFNENAAKKTGI